MKLESIAKIKSGIVLTRKKADMPHEVAAKYPMITARNIEEEGCFNQKDFEIFSSKDTLSPHYFTKKGDIVMRLTEPNTAVYIGEEQEGLLVPAYFVSVEVTHKDYLPEYVAWYLNSQQTKHELKKVQTGTRVNSTSKKVLEDLTIKKITIDKQGLLIDLYQLHYKEKKLYEQLIRVKQRQLDGISKEILID